MRTHSAAGRTIGQGETVAVDVVKIKTKYSTITFVIWIYANLPFFSLIDISGLQAGQS